jgi:hypothetical protein
MQVDFRFGLIYIHGQLFQQTVGFNIGSNLAAGGADLFAAHQESQLLSLISANARFEFGQKVLAQRWADDLWLLLAGTPSEELRAFLKVLCGRYFYHSALLLKPTSGHQAFGFQCFLNRDPKYHISTLPLLKFQRFSDPSHLSTSAPMVAGPSQFLGDRAKRSIVSGYGIRVLDSSVASPLYVLRHLSRVAAELRLSGFPSLTIRRAFTNLNRQANLDVRPALAVLDLPDAVLPVWVSLVDKWMANETLGEERFLKLARNSPMGQATSQFVRMV